MVGVQRIEMGIGNVCLMGCEAVRGDEDCWESCGTGRPVFAAAMRHSMDEGWEGEIGVVHRKFCQAVSGVRGLREDLWEVEADTMREKRSVETGTRVVYRRGSILDKLVEVR